jgi:hypothetical protein
MFCEYDKKELDDSADKLLFLSSLPHLDSNGSCHATQDNGQDEGSGGEEEKDLTQSTNRSSCPITGSSASTSALELGLTRGRRGRAKSLSVFESQLSILLSSGNQQANETRSQPPKGEFWCFG